MARGRVPREPITYTPAPEPENLAREMIADHHRHLSGRRIAFVFRSRAASQGGYSVASTGGPVTDRLKVALGGTKAEWVIEFAKDIWDRASERWKRARVEHELCHCSIGKTGKLRRARHDCEEFVQVIHRHGLPDPDVEKFVRVGHRMDAQTEIPLEEEPATDQGQETLSQAVDAALSSPQLQGVDGGEPDPAAGQRAEDTREARRLARGLAKHGVSATVSVGDSEPVNLSSPEGIAAIRTAAEAGQAVAAGAE